MVGNSLSGWIVCNPVSMANRMTSGSESLACVLALSIVHRSEPSPVSLVLVTYNACVIVTVTVSLSASPSLA